MNVVGKSMTPYNDHSMDLPTRSDLDTAKALISSMIEDQGAYCNLGPFLKVSVLSFLLGERGIACSHVTLSWANANQEMQPSTFSALRVGTDLVGPRGQEQVEDIARDELDDHEIKGGFGRVVNAYPQTRDAMHYVDAWGQAAGATNVAISDVEVAINTGTAWLEAYHLGQITTATAPGRGGPRL